VDPDDELTDEDRALLASAGVEEPEPQMAPAESYETLRAGLGDAQDQLVRSAPSRFTETGRTSQSRVMNLPGFDFGTEGGEIVSERTIEPEADYTVTESREVRPMPPSFGDRLRQADTGAREQLRGMLPSWLMQGALPGDRTVGGYTVPSLGTAADALGTLGRGEGVGAALSALSPREELPEGTEDVRGLRSLAQGGLNAASLNFSDEISGLGPARFLPPLAPFGFAQDILSGSLGERDPEVRQRRARELQAGVSEQDPVGEQLGGHLATLPLALVPGAPSSALGRIAFGAGEGALLSGLSGAGEAEEGQRLEQGLTQGAIGGALGGGLAGAGELASGIERWSAASYGRSGEREGERRAGASG
jgi:hypothetical protein